MTDTEAPMFYIELSSTMDTKLAQRVAAASAKDGNNGSPNQPLLVGETNTLTLGVQVLDSDGIFALNNAIEQLHIVWDTYEVPEGERRDPFRHNILSTAGVIENLTLDTEIGNGGFPDEEDGGNAVLLDQPEFDDGNGGLVFSGGRDESSIR